MYHPEENKFCKALFEKECDMPDRDALGKTVREEPDDRAHTKHERYNCVCCVCISMCFCVCVCVCACMYLCVCMDACMYMCMHAPTCNSYGIAISG